MRPPPVPQLHVPGFTDSSGWGKERRRCVNPVQSTGAPSQAARSRLMAVRGEPLFLADWYRVLMLHFEVNAVETQKCVPFMLDRFEGRAFVTLVAFTLSGLKPAFGGRFAAWLFRPIATHDFLNLRTYVRVNGEAGIHFLAEWLSNPLAVRLGPPTFALPYRRAEIRYDHNWTTQRLRGSVEDRRNAGRVHYTARVPAEPRFAPCSTGTRDEWLMERYSAFNSVTGRQRMFRIWHAPWQQCPVTAELDDLSLVSENWPWMRDAIPAGAAFSPGVSGVWMGRPHRIKSAD